MAGRSWSLVVCLVLPGCAAVAPTRLPSCWESESYKDGDHIMGKVTVLISDYMPDMERGTVVMVTPLTCENGSFRVIDPPSDLAKLSRPFTEGSPIFGRAFEAEVAGTVRLIQANGHLGPENPYHLKLSRVGNLKAVARPGWWAGEWR